MLYRAELLQLHGAWRDAVEETERAYVRLSAPPPEPAVGAAHYQQAELHRLRGEFEHADASYRQASQWGRPPEPGLAQLRLGQGDRKGALGIIRRSLDEVRDHPTRTRLLEPAVDISLANGDVLAARAAANELTEIAETSRAPLVRAMAARALGAVLLAEGDARAALTSLRQAWTNWQGLEAPFEAAQTRVLIGRACRALGDEATAQIEFEAARGVFDELGASPDVERVNAESQPPVATPAARGPENTAGLTAREIEVLHLVAAGMSNRAIADALVISEKTVARHVSNIFLKLDVSSRSAATAYAYEHGLQARTT
jgi:DNA-binding CsgD family transcriptional regulator